MFYIPVILYFLAWAWLLVPLNHINGKLIFIIQTENIIFPYCIHSLFEISSLLRSTSTASIVYVIYNLRRLGNEIFWNIVVYSLWREKVKVVYISKIYKLKRIRPCHFLLVLMTIYVDSNAFHFAGDIIIICVSYFMVYRTLYLYMLTIFWYIG